MRPPTSFDAALRIAGIALAGVLVAAAWRDRLAPGGAGLYLPVAAFAGLCAARLLWRSASAPATPPLAPGRGASLALFLLPAAASALLYRPVLSSWLLADDLYFVGVLAREPFLPALAGWLWPDGADSTQFLRPLSHTLTWILVALFGPDARLLHAVNVALHSAAAGSIALLVGHLTGGLASGLAAGTMLALSPLAVHSVAWINTHQDPIVVLCAAAALLAIARGLAAAERPVLLPALCLLLGLLAKETAISIPVAGIALCLLFPHPRSGSRGGLRTVAALVLVTLGYLGYRWLVFGGMGGYASGGGAGFSRLQEGTLSGILAEVPGTLLVPANQAIVPGAGTLRLCAAAIVVLLLGLSCSEARCARAPRLALLGGAWLCGSLLPVHNMLWLGPHLLNARYLYVSTVAFTLLVTGLLAGLLGASDRPARSAGALVALVLLGLALGLALANRDQWLASASVPAGLADDLRSLDRAGEVDRVAFLGFPDVWEGAYLFNLELLPRIALGREVTGAREPLPRGPGRRVVYRWLGGSRLWQRLEPRRAGGAR